ncbi:MAG TPA: response regulator transcription factor [Flavisolibacter sp.]|jgi:DNA-binding NarL/FixJ family response regulator|nr:response regulator transcription factor [Flavisolibacter sp.]
MKADIALVDDHALLRSGLASLLKDFGYTVLFEADNGARLQEKLKTHPLPKVILMDINMPVMDGIETTLWLKQHYPQIKVLALSMLDEEGTIIAMIRNGAKGYVLKDCEPEELNTAITSVLEKDFYHSELISRKLMQGLSNGTEDMPLQGSRKWPFSEKELEFINHFCTELSYKEIAAKLKISPRTVEDYSATIQEKMEVKSRIGLVLFAVKNGLVKL